MFLSTIFQSKEVRTHPPGGDFLSTVLIIRAALYLVIRDVISISVESQPIAWVPFKSSMR